MIILQILIATAIGTAALLYASTTPSYRPLTDDVQNRIMLSMAITLMVMCLPVCAAGALYSVVMFTVGSMFMFGVIGVAVGPTPHSGRYLPAFVEAKPKVGYRRLNWGVGFGQR